MNKIKLMLLGLLVGIMLAGCSDIPTDAQQTMSDQNAKKLEQSAKVMKTVGVPTFNFSVERENIAKRLTVTNDPNLLQWIYPMSAGRVIGRFPVRGKVTSGNKRLTSTVMEYKIEGDNSVETGVLGEAPDEMGTYGSSGDYIFWFDPSGHFHQHKGDYFLSTEPYKLDKGYGTISTEIDASEDTKRTLYDKQTQSVKGGK